DIKARKDVQRLSMVSVYDFPFARLAEEAGIDILLVGDSLGMVVQGHDSTVPVTLTDIVYHAKAVRRGAPRTHVVADLPFLTYHTDTGRAIENAGRLLQEGGADSVKLEGGQEIAERAAAIVRAGIPVMGHIGLTPQSAGALGGFKVQGRDVASARKILDDARAIVDAGAYAMVVEVIPAELGEMITARVPIPTIGIGAGAACDGQVLVAHDMLGLQERIIGRFAKVYANVGDDVRRAFTAFAEEVRAGSFPDEEPKSTPTVWRRT
ncbi:MAG: 3-methyl-2-oxobutanoatehydroxymethyltransferase, partial [Thermomicrobiales bacterium]|nr:3-methyl-2-oxobutanoatehydroxymethyltransferase [Thermomicrobiales bacterium]